MKPRVGVLAACGTSLASLAEEVYNGLGEEDRKAVDRLTLEIDAGLLEKRGKPHGIGVIGLRELALALYLRCACPGNCMDQILSNGMRCRE